MSYLENADKYLPGEVYRKMYGSNPFYQVLAKAKGNVKFNPNQKDTMSSDYFQRFLNLQRNPSSLYQDDVQYPEGFNRYMSIAREFGLNPGSV